MAIKIPFATLANRRRARHTRRRTSFTVLPPLCQRELGSGQALRIPAWVEKPHRTIRSTIRSGLEFLIRLATQRVPLTQTLVLPLFVLTGLAQETKPLGGLIGGYREPVPVRLSAGQIGTVHVLGMSDLLLPEGTSEIRAESLPLPLELGGVSVSARIGDRRWPVAILSVRSCCTLRRQGISITLHWPAIFESEIGNLAEISVIWKGDEVAMGLVDLGGEAQILAACSGTDVATLTIPPGCDRNAVPVVTHADGSMVRSSNPARSGETLTVWAIGLGGEEQLTINTGAASPSPAIVVTQRVFVSLDFAYDGARNLLTETFRGSIHAALTPGAVGLFQIHIKVPEVPSSTLPCQRLGLPGVKSNLTIGVRTPRFGTLAFREDRIGICVEAPSPEGKAVTQRETTTDAPRFDPTGFPARPSQP